MIENIKKEELNINKLFGEKSRKINISEDFIISDSKPDVLSIVDENGNIFINKIDLLENKIKLSGMADVNVLYLSDTGENRAINHVFEFSEVVDFENISDNMQLIDNIRISDIRSKILNERKINVEIEADLNLVANRSEKVEFVSDFSDDENMQILEREIEFKNLIGTGKSKASIRENLPIDNIDQVLDIVGVQVNVRNVENKPSYNKILSKADVEVDVTYLTVDGNVNSSKREYQAMGFIDIENVNDSNIANSEYFLRNINIDAIGKDEHNINVELDFDILGEVYESRKINCIEDLYNIKEDFEISRKIEKIRNIELFEDIVEISESCGIDELERVLKVCTNARIKNINSLDDCSKIFGEIEYKILYEKQNISGIFIKKVKVPFEKIVQCRGVKEFRIELLENTFVKKENNVTLSSKVKIINHGNNNYRFEFVDDVTRAENCEKEDCYSLVIYFVKQGDTLWKIAKTFKTTVDEIVRVNDIENENNLQIGRKLYIPKVV